MALWMQMQPWGSSNACLGWPRDKFSPAIVVKDDDDLEEDDYFDDDDEEDDDLDGEDDFFEDEDEDEGEEHEI